MKIFIIACEPSGDWLGASLMRALKDTAKDLAFYGIGGQCMETEGLQSLFPMTELSIMGLTEIIKHIFHVKRRIRRTVAYAQEINPDIVVTIDSSGFNFRVVKQLRSRLHVPFIHYVAPPVWAWRPWRAKKVAKLYDHLLCLLPFEPPYFPGLPATFVGHPVNAERVSFPRMRESSDAVTIILLPGSRVQEVKRLLPIFREAIAKLKRPVTILLPTLPHLVPTIEALMQGCAYTLVLKDKHLAFQRADIALAASGTVTLELAKAGVPCVVGYKVSAITAWLARRLVKVSYASLINILLNQPIIPEYLQERCTPDLIAAQMQAILNDEKKQTEMRAHYQTALAMLGENASHKAAEVIWSYL